MREIPKVQKVESGTRAIKIPQLLNKMAARCNAEKKTFFFFLIVKNAGGSTLNHNKNSGNLPVLRFYVMQKRNLWRMSK